MTRRSLGLKVTGALVVSEKGKAKEPKRKRVDAEGQGQELLELLRACVGTAQGLSPTQPPVEIKLGEEFSSVLKKMNKTLESVARAQGNGVDSDSESDDGSLLETIEEGQPIRGTADNL